MKNESVLITGSSKGLGEELALVFADNNHDLIIHGRNKEDLARVKAKVSKKGVNCHILAGDLQLDKTIEELYKLAKETDVSVLINNAGTDLNYEDAPDKLKLQFTKISDKQIDEIITTNLIAPIKLTRRLYSLFLDKGHGTIININSLSGMEPHWRRTVYGASKWGLRGFTDTLRKEAKEDNIRILGVYPDRIYTKPFFKDGMEPQEVARNIYDAYKNTHINEIKLNGRPKK
ncbi:SDR family NAD(P)-dependent oxidoreductase [Chloroflexota bacterium]